MAPTCELNFEGRKYLLNTVTLEGHKPFWAIEGSKKGTRHTGGGIAIYNMHVMEGLCHLLRNCDALDSPLPNSTESKVDYFSLNSRDYCGETRCFDGDWYYRIKAYNSNFSNKEGDIKFYKGHKLNPSGFRFYIQEFDFPLIKNGDDEATQFANTIKSTIESHLENIVSGYTDKPLPLLRNNQLLVDNELPWINTCKTGTSMSLGKPIHDIICDQLRKEPLSIDQLSAQVNITPQTAKDILPLMTARYDKLFLDRNILLDRLSRDYDSTHYLATEIPIDVIQTSPTLVKLFENTTGDDWIAWKNVTFSNDEYSKGRSLSISFAEFAIEAFEGGMKWGLVPDLGKVRATAIRLFDLVRHCEGQEQQAETVKTLVDRFISIARAIEHE